VRRRQGGLVANEEALLELLADVYPSWVTTGDLTRMVHDRQAAGTWVVRRGLPGGTVCQWPASTSKVDEATVYRMLARFAARAWIDAKWWVPDDPWSKDRPARIVVLNEDRPARIVVLNEDGRARARQLVAPAMLLGPEREQMAVHPHSGIWSFGDLTATTLAGIIEAVTQ